MEKVLKDGHKGASELTDEEAAALAEAIYEEECRQAEESETPPEYIDGSESSAVGRMLSDLENEDGAEVVFEELDDEA